MRSFLHAEFPTVFFYKFYFKISLAYICLLMFPFYSRTIMAQLKDS